MATPKHRRQYYIITEQRDRSLTCDCTRFKQTGKSCEHIVAVRLEIQYGSVLDYEGMWLLFRACLTDKWTEKEKRTHRGRASAGQARNPQKKSTGVKLPGRRQDRIVDKEYDLFLKQVHTPADPWAASNLDTTKDGTTKTGSSDSESDENAEGVEVDDPVVRMGSQGA
ncbi:hypothetical protein C8F01DRAFT_981961 [Mycena amicta]|nr:hypothetical protein C8F01DRAFT_981961 [Mycena amicta]